MLNQLFLEADGVGGDDDAMFFLFFVVVIIPRFFFVTGGGDFGLGSEDGGDEIGEALADSCAGFGDEMFFAGDGLFDGLGHGQLFGAGFISRQPACDGACRSQYAGDVVYGFGHAGFRYFEFWVNRFYCVRKCDCGTATTVVIPVSELQFPAGSWIPERD